MMKNGMIAWYHRGYHAYDWKWGATIKYEHRLVLFGVGRHYKIRRGFESLIAVEWKWAATIKYEEHSPACGADWIAFPCLWG